MGTHSTYNLKPFEISETFLKNFFIGLRKGVAISLAGYSFEAVWIFYDLYRSSGPFPNAFLEYEQSKKTDVSQPPFVYLDYHQKCRPFVPFTYWQS